MAITAAAGGGNWTVGATWVGGIAPGAADDVLLTGTSGNVTADSGATCRNFDATGYTNTLTLSATLTTNPTTTVKFVAGMTIAGTGSLTIDAAAASTATFTSGGKTFQNLNIAGSTTGAVTFADTNSITGIVSLVTGTLNTNGQGCTWGSFSSNNTNTRTLTMGASAILINGGGGQVVNGTGLTITSNTAVITFSAQTDWNAGNINWNGASFAFTYSGSGQSTLRGTFTCANLTQTGGASNAGGLNITAIPTVTGTITINGASVANRLYWSGATLATAQTITAAVVSMSNVDFEDITGAGAGTWSGTNIGNMGGCSGITFRTPTNYFSLGGAYSTTTNWSLSTGGASAGTIPLPQDSAFLDANTSTNVSIDHPRVGGIDATNYTHTLSFGVTCQVNGGLKFGASMGYSSTAGFKLTFTGRSSYNIDTLGVTLSFQNVTITAPGGTYTLQSDLIVGISSGPRTFSMTAGGFNANGHNVTAGNYDFSVAGTRTLTGGSGTWTAYGSTGATTFWNMQATGMTFNFAGTTIALTDTTTGGAQTFAGAGFTYGTLNHIKSGTANTLAITGNNTFTTLDMETTTTLTLPASGTQNVTNLILRGASLTTPLVVNSSTPGTASTLAMGSSSNAVLILLSMQDIAVTGTSMYFAYGTVNVSGNSGINFSTYPVAAGGNWSSTATWNTGVVPTAATDVSMVNGSGNVTIDPTAGSVEIASLYCGTYAGTLNCGGFGISLGNSRSTFANFVLGGSMTITNAATLLWHSGAIGNLVTNGKTWPGSVQIGAGVSGGTVSFGDTNTITGAVTLVSGTLNTGNQTCTWGSFVRTATNTSTITLGSSQITITTSAGWGATTATNLTVTANTATITLSASDASFSGAATNWNGTNLVITGGGSTTVTSGTVQNLTYTGTALKTNNVTFGSAITFAVTGTLTVSANSLINRVLLQSSVLGTARTVSAGTLVTSNVIEFMDIAATGAATWSTASGATSFGDCGGNSGVTFTASSTQTWQGTSGGNWSDVTKWTSRVPLSQDDVNIASAFSASQTISPDMPRLGRTINWTGSTGAPTWNFSGGIVCSFFGSIMLATGMLTSNNNTTFIAAGRSSQTFTSNGVSFATALTMLAPGGTLTFADTLTIPAGGQQLTLTAGTLTASANMSLSFFQTSGSLTKVLNMGSGIWALTRTGISGWQIGGTGLTINAGKSIIDFTQVGSGTRTFTGGGFTYSTVRMLTTGSENFAITGNNTFVNLDLECTTARTVTLPAGGTQIVTGQPTFTGATGQNLSFVSSSPGTAATINASGAFASKMAFLTLSADVTITAPKGFSANKVQANPGDVWQALSYIHVPANSGSVPVTLGLIYRDVNGYAIGSQRGATVTDTTTWGTQYSVTGNAPAGTKTAELSVGGVFTNGQTATIKIDANQLFFLNPDSAQFADSGSKAAVAVPSATGSYNGGSGP